SSITVPAELWILTSVMLTSGASVPWLAAASVGLITSARASGSLFTLPGVASYAVICSAGPCDFAVPLPEDWTIDTDASVAWLTPLNRIVSASSAVVGVSPSVPTAAVTGLSTYMNQAPSPWPSNAWLVLPIVTPPPPCDVLIVPLMLLYVPSALRTGLVGITSRPPSGRTPFTTLPTLLAMIPNRFCAEGRVLKSKCVWIA